MKKIFILFTCVLQFNLPLYSQFRVSVQDDCLEYNSALLDKCMIEVFGETFVSQWLENKDNIIYNRQDSTYVGHRGILLHCDINIEGDVTDLKPIKNRCNLSELQLEKLKQYIIESKVNFCFCFEYDGCIPIDRAHNLAYEYEKEYLEEHGTNCCIIYFPGLKYCMNFNNEQQSKYESLCKYIDYYLKPSKQDLSF